VIGTPGRPRALVVDLGDGPVASAPLAPAVRDQLPPAPHPGPPTTLNDGTHYRPLPAPLPVEVLRTTGRHATTAVLRIH
jgi:hypothetical protein